MSDYCKDNSTKKGDIVFDGFGGSGSTLIACEKLNRKARLCEIEPKFVDVTIMRWQDLTGCEAINQHGIKWNSIVSDNMSAMEEFFEVTDEPRS